MKYSTSVFYVLLILSFLSLRGLKAQDAVLSSGGSGDVIGQGSVCYSLGQIFCTSVKTVDGEIIVGVQQPYEISVPTGFTNPLYSNHTVRVYPTSVTDDLLIEVGGAHNQEWSFQLFDLTGVPVLDGKLYSDATYVYLGHLLPSVYLLRVKNGDTLVKVYKIIKK